MKQKRKISQPRSYCKNEINEAKCAKETYRVTRFRNGVRGGGDDTANNRDCLPLVGAHLDHFVNLAVPKISRITQTRIYFILYKHIKCTHIDFSPTKTTRVLKRRIER